MNMYDYILESKEVLLDIIENFKNISISKYKKICIIATGSSYNAALSTKYFLEKTLDVNINILEPFNYINYSKFDENVDLYILISQSGKSASIINAFRYIKDKGDYKTLVISSNNNCEISQKADYYLDLNMGVETVGFVTKGFLATVLNLMLLAIYNSKLDIEKNINELKDGINKFDEIIDYANSLYFKYENKFEESTRFSCIAYGNLYGICKEFETKFTETVRFPSVGYELEAYMHGPYLEVNKNHFLIFLTYNDEMKERSALLEKYMKKYANETMLLNFDVENENIIILYMALVVQVLSYKVSALKGVDISKRIMDDFDTVLKSKI